MYYLRYGIRNMYSTVYSMYIVCLHANCTAPVQHKKNYVQISQEVFCIYYITVESLSLQFCNSFSKYSSSSLILSCLFIPF